MAKRNVVGVVVLLSSLVAVAGCMEDPGLVPEVGAARRPSTAVTWTATANVTVSGNDMSKSSGGLSWNGGGISVETIDRRGYLTFTSAENTTDKAAGLSHGDTDKDLTDIDFAFYLHADGSLTIREGGTHKTTIGGGYAANDVFKVEVKSGTVKYYKNGSLVYTSLSSPTFPLLVDTALRTVGSTINDVALTTTKLHVGTQAVPLPGGRLSCGDSDVVVVNGSFLLQQSDTITFQDFLGKTQQQVETRLGTYVSNNPEMDGYDQIIILDMESPHPNDLHTYSSTDEDAIVDAWITRIAAANAVFPDATIGMYGTLVPNGQGDDQNATYQARVAALVEAGEEGLYEGLDFLVPVLYVRFGCDDEMSGPPDCDADWDTLDEYTALGVTGSRELEKIDDSVLPLLPLLTVSVANGNSNFNDVMLLDLGVSDPLEATIGTQLDILAGEDVLDAVLWIGNGDNYASSDVLDVTAANPNDWTIDDYACEI